MTGEKRRPSSPPDPLAALRDLETRSANAWKSSFQQRLALWASHFPTPTEKEKPLTDDDKRAVADVIGRLQKLLRGRPRGEKVQWTNPDLLILEKSELARAMRSAALQAAADRVRDGLRKWCKENDYERVPASKTDELFAELIPMNIERVRSQWSEVAPDVISAKDAKEVRRLVRKK